MNTENKTKQIKVNKHLRFIIGIIILCTIFYYLPVISGLAGWKSFQDSLNNLHDIYGIDFLGLVFFAPVVYTAYVLGVVPAILTALVCMLILLPHAILMDTYANALFKPTAFVIILGAVGAVVAMLQKSEQQHHQRINEMKCLYDIGRATGDSSSVEDFLSKVTDMIPVSMQSQDDSAVKITYQEQVYKSHNFQKFPGKISENLVINGENTGTVEIYSSRDNPYLKKRNHLAKTLADRISAGIRQIELEQSLRHYYERLETEVENRTRDLEQVQEKLIRSERLAAVGELASGVGHELRNPLNVIRNCAYLLNMALSTGGDEESLNTLKVLDKQIDIANKIVTDLLDFTRIRPPTLVRVDVNALIRESLTWITTPEHIVIKANLNGHAVMVRTDAEQVSRVFTNIITNAIQAMNGKEGGILNIVSCELEDKVAINFTDNGCGIPSENIQKIFEPLFTTKPKGIGLGLAISKRLIEQNGGKIEVASEIGQGTTFTIELPLDKRRETVNE